MDLDFKRLLFRRLKELFCLLSACVFGLSCTRNAEIDLPENPLPWVVQGEICVGKPVSVSISTAQSFSLSAQKQSMENILVILQDEAQKEELAKLKLDPKNKKWIADFIPEAGKSYNLQLENANERASFSVKLPSKFYAKILNKTTYGDLQDELTVLLKNENEQTQTYYVIECLQVHSDDSLSLRYLESMDVLTDNVSFNELNLPYNRLFVQTVSNQMLLKLRTPKPAYGEKFVLRIKSVDADYYRFLYEYELQKDREQTYLYIRAYNGFLGIVGGVSVADVSLQR